MFNLNKKHLISIISVVFALLVISGLVAFLKAPTLSILEYPLKFFSLLKKEAGGIIFYHPNMVASERLRKENDFLKQKLYGLNEVYLENRRLKNLLSFKQKNPYRVIACMVIARSSDSWTSSIVIDKGSSNGIKKGAVVISFLGLVGRVVEVSPATAKVLLINDPNSSVAALVERSRQDGLISGTLGGTLVVKYLPADADINVSDMVLTSGLTDAFPKGLLIGKVLSVGEEFSGLSRYAVVKPAVNLATLEEVLVIVP